MNYLKKFNEGWRENLAVGLSLAGSVAIGQNNPKDVKKDKIEQTAETTNQKIDRMSKDDGYGFGSSIDLSTAKKIALMDSKIKGVIKEECLIRNSDGKYDYHIIVK